jgi:hypothetical protein
MTAYYQTAYFQTLTAQPKTLIIGEKSCEIWSLAHKKEEKANEA